MLKVACVVVLFKPPPTTLKLISDCLEQFDFVIAVVNEASPDFLGRINNAKLITIRNTQNLGLGKALNQGVKKAEELQCKAVVTFDQDSHIESDFRSKMQKQFQELSVGHRVGLLSPSKFDQLSKNPLSPVLDLHPHPVKLAITSGSFYPISVFEKVGYFSEELFIDYIDFEFCLRLRKSNFELFQIPDISLYHQYGEMKKHQVGPVSFYSSHHSLERRYSITRNRFFCYKKYFKFDPIWVLQDVGSFFKETLKIVLVETQKMQKLKTISKGVVAGLCH